MKKEFFFKIKVEVEEPPKGKDGNEKSDILDVLIQLENSIKKINVKKGNTTAVVKKVTSTSSDESTIAGPEQRLLEDKSFVVSGIRIFPDKSDPLFAPEINYIEVVREKIEAVLKAKRK